MWRIQHDWMHEMLPDNAAAMCSKRVRAFAEGRNPNRHRIHAGTHTYARTCTHACINRAHAQTHAKAHEHMHSHARMHETRRMQTHAHVRKRARSGVLPLLTRQVVLVARDFPSCEVVVTDTFESKAELIQLVLASTHIPFVSGTYRCRSACGFSQRRTCERACTHMRAHMHRVCVCACSRCSRIPLWRPAAHGCGLTSTERASAPSAR